MIAQYKVIQLIQHITNTLKQEIDTVDVIGEISEVNYNNRSGHVYYKLKEQNVTVKCVCWKSSSYRFKDLLKEGNLVKIRAKLSVFSNNGEVYLSTLFVVPYGEGNIAQHIAKIKEKLEKEGLFDSSHKLSISVHPKAIGLITSKDGVVIEDIKSTLSTKAVSKIVLYNASVQGENSVTDIISGIQKFNQLEDKVDFIIIARGGGSAEDLFHFNDEILVRALYQSKIPIITAIGHQPNSTLIDLVADKSVATPTASVMFLPSKDMLHDMLYNVFVSYKKNFMDILDINHRSLNYLSKIGPSNLLQIIDLKKDYLYGLSHKINNVSYFLSHFEKDLRYYQQKFLSAEYLVRYYQQKLDSISNFTSSLNYKLHDFQIKLNHNFAIWENKDIQPVLNKGYALLRNNKQKIVLSKKDIKTGEYSLQLQDGDIKVHLSVLSK